MHLVLDTGSSCSSELSSVHSETRRFENMQRTIYHSIWFHSIPLKLNFVTFSLKSTRLHTLHLSSKVFLENYWLVCGHLVLFRNLPFFGSSQEPRTCHFIPLTRNLLQFEYPNYLYFSFFKVSFEDYWFDCGYPVFGNLWRGRNVPFHALYAGIFDFFDFRSLRFLLKDYRLDFSPPMLFQNIIYMSSLLRLWKEARFPVLYLSGENFRLFRNSIFFSFGAFLESIFSNTSGWVAAIHCYFESPQTKEIWEREDMPPFIRLTSLELSTWSVWILEWFFSINFLVEKTTTTIRPFLLIGNLWIPLLTFVAHVCEAQLCFFVSDTRVCSWYWKGRNFYRIWCVQNALFQTQNQPMDLSQCN